MWHDRRTYCPEGNRRQFFSFVFVGVTSNPTSAVDRQRLIEEDWTRPCVSSSFFLLLLKICLTSNEARYFNCPLPCQLESRLNTFNLQVNRSPAWFVRVAGSLFGIVMLSSSVGRFLLSINRTASSVTLELIYHMHLIKRLRAFRCATGGVYS